MNWWQRQFIWRRMTVSAPQFILVILFMAPAHIACAHSGGASYVELQEDTAANRVQVDLPLPDLESELELDADGDGLLRWREVLDAQPRIVELLTRRMRLQSAGQACKPVVAAPLQLARRETGLHLRTLLSFDCHGAAPDTLDAARWLQDLPDHGIYVSWADAPGRVALLAGSIDRLDLTAQGKRDHEASSLTATGRFLLLGIEHLLTGYDHLAFLTLLLLGTLRGIDRRTCLRKAFLQAIKVVTAFTAAHSITLALAATGLVRLPVAPVEAAIAGSIVFTAVAILWAAMRNAPPGSGGWRLAFGFGLIHGLGFANVLAELLSGTNLVRSLLAFNLGIEIAQLGIVLVVLPLLWLVARRPDISRYASPALVAGIGLLACVWLVERVA